MAIATGKTRCITCGKDKATFKCGGCSQGFCYNHLTDHKQELSKQLDEVEVSRDIFRQTLTEQTAKPQKYTLIEQIDKWERDSIDKVRQNAEETRQLVLKHTTEHIIQLETRLHQLTGQLRQSREENDFFETDLRRWNKELSQLTEELANLSHINLRQNSTALVTKITVDVTSVSLRSLEIDVNASWVQNGVTIAGGNGKGNDLNQFSNPWGLCVDDDQTVYVADHSNHCILEWKCNSARGRVVAGGHGSGNQAYHLNCPTDVIVDKKSDCLVICDRENKRIVRWPRRNGTSGQTIISNIGCWSLAMDNDGYLYVADYDKYEVKRWRVSDSSRTVVAGGNGNGSRLDQLSGRFYIFVDEDHSVYVSEENNHRVTKWMKGAKQGIVVAGGHGKGNSLIQLAHPSGVVVDQAGTVYVADQSNHRIMRWPKGAKQGTIVVGGNGKGQQINQFSYPLGLTIDRQGNLYVVDNSNYRVQRFDINSR